MPDSQCYRYKATQCLLAAKEASEPSGRKLRLSMASSWLSLARQEEANYNLRAGPIPAASDISSLNDQAESQAPAKG
jgi:hypothetical protein